MSLTLHQAAESGQVQTVEQLLAEGADVNAAGFGSTRTFYEDAAPLYIAATEGHTHVVQLLLAAGANVNAKDAYGDTPLHAAAARNSEEVAQLLLAAGAGIDAAGAQGKTPLMSAVVRGRTEMVQLLLRSGANPGLCNALGDTAVSWAAVNAQADILQLLIDAWGQPQIPAAVLIHAARAAARYSHWSEDRDMARFAWLAKNLRQLYPTQLHQLFEGPGSTRFSSFTAAEALAATISEWDSDVSSLDEQRAAVRRREENVAQEQQAVQRLIVGVARMARDAQQDLD